MLKNSIISLLVLLIIGIIACHSPRTSPPYSPNPSEFVEAEMDTAIFDSIDIWIDSTWEAIEQDWLNNHFYKCLKSNKVEVSCADCPAAFMDLYFYIDATGKLVKHRIVRAKYCGKPALEACFLSYFYAYSFPSKYHNKFFRLRLGRALKC